MNNTVKKVLSGILFVVILIVIWNLFDLIWQTWFTRNGYTFSMQYHILYPVGLGVFVFLVMFVFTVARNKKK